MVKFTLAASALVLIAGVTGANANMGGSGSPVQKHIEENNARLAPSAPDLAPGYTALYDGARAPMTPPSANAEGTSRGR